MTFIYEQTQTSDLFHDLKKMGRDNFSYEGAKVLMEYLEELAGDIGEPIEYDPIAFCCEFSEYETLDEFNDQQGTNFKSWDDLMDETTVIPVGDKGAIVQDY